MKPVLHAFIIAAAALLAGGTFAQAATDPTHYFMVKLNVTDLQRSVDYYVRLVGMKEVRRSGGATPEASLEILLSESGSDREPEVVLVYQKGKGPFEMGTAFNDIVFVVQDVRAAVKRITNAGYPVTLQPREVNRTEPSFATGLTVAFVKDPDGYPVELLQWNN